MAVIRDWNTSHAPEAAPYCVDTLRLFASDVMGEMTFSRRLGFLETGTDMEGLMESNWMFFVKAAPVLYEYSPSASSC